ncbi:MAG: hypothetical protein M3178_01065 [Pseudomonadota bacterium]|nr:hypothetical protein [Pseudomonadota bacterium]
MSEPSRRELLKAVYTVDLNSFVERSFGVLEPGNQFMPAAYLERLSAALMQVDARKVTRLIVNMPPRHLKSIVTSVVFPAWLLMRDPKTKCSRSSVTATCSATTWRRNASASSPTFTGLDEPLRGTITVVHQRLHEADLSGYLLSRGGWEILCLPRVAEAEKTHKFGNYEWRRPVGDVLLPERFPDAEIQKIRANNGETIFATQWWQNPASTRGELT